MRQKWTAILVVMFTTLTTVQEAVKQYDAFKTEASTWATLSLWTGFLNAYEPPSQPLQTHVTTCQAEQLSAQSQQPEARVLARTIRREIATGRRHDTSLRFAVSVIEDHRASEALEAGRQALASVREVALLDANDDAEETFKYRAEMRSPAVSLRELHEVEVALHDLGRERADDAYSQAALRQTRTVTRAQTQKSRAMKRALKTLQTRFDKATRQELSRAKGEFMADLPDGMSMAFGLPLAPPQPVVLPVVMTNSGGCAGE